MALASDVATCVPQTGVTDSDRISFGDILSAAALLAAGYSIYKAYDIAYAEWEMAKKYWQLAENWLQYYKDYFAPVEDQEIEEALALEYVEPAYEIARGRARTLAWLEFRGKLRESMHCTSRYVTGLRNDMLTRIARAQADAVAMADGLGYRNERAYTETRNDVIFDRKLNTAKRGRDIIADTVSVTAAAAGIYGDLFDQAWAGLEGAGKYLGYRSQRIQPAYPSTGLVGSGPGGRFNMSATLEAGGIYKSSTQPTMSDIANPYSDYNRRIDLTAR